MICPQRDGGEPQVCHSDGKAHVLTPSCVAFTKGYLTPRVSSTEQQLTHGWHAAGLCPSAETAGVLGPCSCRGELGWVCRPLASLHPRVFCSKHSCDAHLGGGKSSLPAASHGEKERCEKSQVSSLTASPVMILRQYLDFRKRCDWGGGRNGLALFTRIQVSHQGCPATSGNSPSCRSTMGTFTAPERIPSAFVPQMNIDIKVLPLLMSIDVLFSVFKVLGDREVFTG